MADGLRVTKNPRPFRAVGFYRNFSSVSTSANGVVNYDDQQNDLSNISEHCALKIRGRSRKVKRRILENRYHSLIEGMYEAAGRTHVA